MNTKKFNVQCGPKFTLFDFFHCVFSYMLTQITCQVSELDRSEHKSVQRGRLQAAGRGVSVNPFYVMFYVDFF